MPLKVTFELDDKDLRYFRKNMKHAREAAGAMSEAEVLTQASVMVSEVAGAKVVDVSLVGAFSPRGGYGSALKRACKRLSIRHGCVSSMFAVVVHQGCTPLAVRQSRSCLMPR